MRCGNGSQCNASAYIGICWSKFLKPPIGRAAAHLVPFSHVYINENIDFSSIKQNLIQKTYRDTLNPRLVAYFDGKLLPDRNSVNPVLLPVVVAGVNVEKLLSNRKFPGSDIGVVMGKAVTVEIREGFLIGWLDARSAMEQ